MFSVESFAANPSVGLLTGLTKAQWCDLAAHYEVPVRASSRKDEICALVAGYLVDNEIISESDLQIVCPSDVTSFRQYDLEKRRLELERLKLENERVRLMQQSTNIQSGFRINDAVKLVPKFNEDEPDNFLITLNVQLIFMVGQLRSGFYSYMVLSQGKLRRYFLH